MVFWWTEEVKWYLQGFGKADEPNPDVNLVGRVRKETKVLLSSKIAFASDSVKNGILYKNIIEIKSIGKISEQFLYHPYYIEKKNNYNIGQVTI